MKKWIWKAALGLAAGIFAVITAAVIWYQHAVTVSQPQISGAIAVEGVLRPVEIVRDKFGIPHIYADNARDLYLGMGFAMAQDRLWQMEFLRRLGQGRLAEVLGEPVGGG